MIVLATWIVVSVVVSLIVGRFFRAGMVEP